MKTKSSPSPVEVLRAREAKHPGLWTSELAAAELRVANEEAQALFASLSKLGKVAVVYGSQGVSVSLAQAGYTAHTVEPTLLGALQSVSNHVQSQS